MHRRTGTSGRHVPAVIRAAGWAALLAFVAAGPGRADERCAFDAGPPAVRFETKLGDIAYHNDRDRSQFQRLAPQRRTPGADWFTTGMTIDEIKLDLKVEVGARRLGDGRYCVALSGASARLGYDEINVFIDRRYRPGSCQYRSILDHELKHVAVHGEAVRRYGQAMESALGEAARSTGPFVASSAKAGAERLKRWLDQALRPLFRDMQQGIDRADAVLDSRDNYEREQKQCPTW